MGGKTRNSSVIETGLLALLIATISAVLAALIIGFITIILFANLGYFFAVPPTDVGWNTLAGLILSIPVALITGACCWFTVFIVVVVLRTKKKDYRTIVIYAFFIALLYPVLASLVFALLGLFGYIY